jgi:hypothetical protein
MRFETRVITISLAIFFGGITYAYATTYYISSGGDDNNSGTSRRQAWRTINRVNSAVFAAGDNILFKGGKTFTGSLYFDSTTMGTDSLPITISSYGNGRATIQAGTDDGLFAYNTSGYLITNINFVGAGREVSNGDGIIFYNDLPGNTKLNYVHIDNVEVSGFGGAGIAIQGANGNSGFQDISITNTEAHDNADTGILIWGPFSSSSTGYAHENIYIGYTAAYNNSGIPGLSFNTGNGIEISDVDGGVIERSVAYNNGWLNTAVGGPVGIWACYSNNISIQYNESFDNHTASSSDGGGFDLDGGVTNSVMQYNYSHDNDGAGFLLAQFSDVPPFFGNTIRYNISQNDGRKNSFGGIRVWNGGSGIKNSEIYNNTVYMSPANSGSPKAISIFGSTLNVHVRNNIFITTGGLQIVNVSFGQSGMLFQGNDYWSSGSSFAIKWDSTTYTSLGSWRNATGQEKMGTVNTGFNIDPELVNSGGGGTLGDATLLSTLTAYQLQSTSPLIDAGLNLMQFGINPGTRDFYGDTIPQGPAYDVGAYDTTRN